MISIRGAALCAATFSLLAGALWVLNTAAARTFLCTFRNLCLFQKIVEVVAASLEDGPREPTPTRSPTPSTPQSPPRIRDDVVAPVAAHGLINVNDYPSDVWIMCLRFVDQASLVNVEMTAKTLPAQLDGALNDAWVEQDERIDPKMRAVGETARDRAIGSCAAFRIQIMARYAQAVEAAKPSGNHEVQASLGMGLRDEHEIYVRISDRRGQNHLGTFLAGGVVKPVNFSEWLPWTMGETNSIFLEINKGEIRQSSWPSMRQFLNENSEGFAQLHRHNSDKLKRDMLEALGYAAVTAVAIHRTSLSLSIIMACDNITDAKRYQPLSYYTDLGPVLRASTRCVFCTIGTIDNALVSSMSMDVSSWDGGLVQEWEGDEDGDLVFPSKMGRSITFYLTDGRFGLNVSTELTHGRRCYCVHRFGRLGDAVNLVLLMTSLIWIHKHGGIFHDPIQVALVLFVFLVLSGNFQCTLHASKSIWDFFLLLLWH